MDLLSLPFDQYQRYRLIADLVSGWREHRAGSRLSILDIGGFARALDGDPYLPLEHFLPEEKVCVYDLQACDLPNYVQIGDDPNSLPEEEFHVVVACDVLEHLDVQSRAVLIGRVLDISQHLAVLIGPVGTEMTRRSERIVNLFHRSLTGEDHSWLAEHAHHGLPSASAIRGILEGRSMPYVELHSGNMYRWVFMMMTRLYVQTLPEYAMLLPELNHFYNRYFHTADQRKPGYRRVFVVATSKEGQAALEIAQAMARRAARHSPHEGQGLSAVQHLSTALIASRIGSREVLVDGSWQRQTITGPIWGDHVLSFEVHCPLEEFSRIDLYLATFGRRIGKEVVIELEDSGDASRWSHRACLPPAAVVDNFWHTIRFPEVHDSGGRSYRIRLSAPGLTEGSPVTAYCSDGGVPAHRIYCAVGSQGDETGQGFVRRLAENQRALDTSLELQKRMEADVLELQKQLAMAEGERKSIAAVHAQALERLSSAEVEVETLRYNFAEQVELLTAAEEAKEELSRTLEEQVSALSAAHEEQARLDHELRETQDTAQARSARISHMEQQVEDLNEKRVQHEAELVEIEAIASERSMQIDDLEKRLQEMITADEISRDKHRSILLELLAAASGEA